MMTGVPHSGQRHFWWVASHTQARDINDDWRPHTQAGDINDDWRPTLRPETLMMTGVPHSGKLEVSWFESNRGNMPHHKACYIYGLCHYGNGLVVSYIDTQ